MNYKALIEALIGTLQQEQTLLAALSPEIYTAPGQGAFKSSIGAHIRHNLDHFASFFEGLPKGRIDYEQRRRDGGIARSAEHAMAEIDKQIEALTELGRCDRTGRVAVREENDTGERNWLESSVGRELQFLLGHTVHHHAIIVLLLGQKAVPLPEGFGVAPSTQRHERHQVN
jgi:uncharacterized damage-inducible protein DinB